MQELSSYLNNVWVGIILTAALAVYLHWRSQIPGIVALQSHNVSMIGGGDAVFPAEVEVKYQGTSIPRLTSSTVWIWNAGKKTVMGEKIVPKDPLRLNFNGEVLNIRIRKVSREVVNITADTSEDIKRMVCFSFDFLDPDDGGVLEVLHSGSAEAPECSGSIIGIPKGPQYWGHAWGAYTSSKSKDNRTQRFIAMAPAMVVGLILCVAGILGERDFGEQFIEFIPFDAGWPLVPLGLVYALGPAYFLWRFRRRIPSSLVVDAIEGEEGPLATFIDSTVTVLSGMFGIRKR